LKTFIENYEDLASISQDISKLKTILNKLDIKFRVISTENLPKELIDFIYRENHYALNPYMMRLLLNLYGKIDLEQFELKNFSCIKGSGAELLIERSYAEINDYVEGVFLKIESNTKEEEEILIELLNDVNLTIENGKKVLAQVDAKIYDFTKIKRSKFYEYLIVENKIKPNWSNMLEYHNYYNGAQENDIDEEDTEEEIPDEIVDFINVEENALELSKMNMPMEVKGNNIYETFCRALMVSDRIELNSYKLITKSSPWRFSNLNIEHLDSKRVPILINNGVIWPVLESFVQLKEYHPDCRVLLIEKYPDEFLKIEEDLNFDTEDLKEILNSKTISAEYKNQFIQRTDDSVLSSNNEILSWIADRLVENRINLEDLSDILIKKVLTCISISAVKRIAVFLKAKYFGDDFSVEFLNYLGANYSDINDTSKRAILVDNQVNRDLLDFLKLKGRISSYSDKSKKKTLKVYHKMV
jgi:hypothetical protein